eukprot:1131485-Rhodomonas_salina.1
MAAPADEAHGGTKEHFKAHHTGAPAAPPTKNQADYLYQPGASAHLIPQWTWTRRPRDSPGLRRVSEREPVRASEIEIVMTPARLPPWLRVPVLCRHRVHPKIEYKKPQFQYNLYQSCSFLYLISRCSPSQRSQRLLEAMYKLSTPGPSPERKRLPRACAITCEPPLCLLHTRFLAPGFGVQRVT